MSESSEGDPLNRIRGRLATVTGVVGGLALLACLLTLLPVGPPASAAPGPGPFAHASIGYEPEPVPLATDAAGHVFVSNPISPYEIEEYSADGTLMGHVRGYKGSASAIAGDAAGDIWIADWEDEKVTELGPGRSVLRSWLVTSHLAMAVDPGGADVYLTGPGEEVERYSSSGSLIAKWSLPKKAILPYGIAIGPDGFVYVADSADDRVFVYEPDGTLVREWPTATTAAFSGLPYGIAVAPSGDVYLADTMGDRVEQFTANGTPIRTWGGAGGGKGHFETPTAVAVGAEGDVYVADEAIEYPGTGTARIQRFTAAGAFVNEWGYIPKPPPDRPTVTGAPPHQTTSEVAAFSFHSGEGRATFLCRLTGAGVPRKQQRFRPCSSPKRYRKLAPGRKTFAVIAVVGGRRSRPATRAWTVLTAAR